MAGYPCCCRGCRCQICTGDAPDMQTTMAGVTGDLCEDCDDHNGEVPLACVGEGQSLPETILSPAQEGTHVCKWEGSTVDICEHTSNCLTCDGLNPNGCDYTCNTQECTTQDDCEGEFCPTTLNSPCDLCDDECDITYPLESVPVGEVPAPCQCTYDPMEDISNCVCGACVVVINDCGSSQFTHEKYLYVNEDGFATIYYVIQYHSGDNLSKVWHGEYVHDAATIDCETLDINIDMELLSDEGIDDDLCALDDEFTIQVTGV
jgi:hypothetical protein